MRHHFWEWPIATYLFLGGLGGGIFTLTAVCTFFVGPGLGFSVEEVGSAFAFPCFIALAALAFGCFLLVFELGQPLVFVRVFLKSTSIICWGARILTVCLIFGFLWWCSFIPWVWFAPVAHALAAIRTVSIAVAGVAGFAIMLYTGILLSTLKAHSFWATPVLPVLFTISALSTACAVIILTVGLCPSDIGAAALVATSVHGMVHTMDIILVIAEITVLLIMVLSFLGAGNVVAHDVAARWVYGREKVWFWGGMIGCGLALPLVLNVCASEVEFAQIFAALLVLAGGLLLRFLIVYADDRQEIPGENAFYEKLPRGDEQFISAWKQGHNLY